MKKISLIIVIGIIAIIGIMTFVSKNKDKKSDYTIYTAQKIVTMENDNMYAEAIALDNKGYITSVGSLNQVKKDLNGKNFKIDNETFKNKVIYPGFVDPHLHFWLMAIVANLDIIAPEDWDFPWSFYKGVTNHKEYMERLRALDRKTPKNQILVTWGYHELFHGKLNKAILDKEFPDRPILILHRSLHKVIMNTKGIEFFKLSKSDFEGIHKYQADYKEGTAWEAGLFFQLLPKIFPYLASEENLTKGLKKTKELVSYSGLTTIADQGIALNAKQIKILVKVLEQGDTSFMHYLIPNFQTLYLEHGDKAFEAMKELEKIRSEHVDWLDHQAKLFTDGAIFSQAMQLKKGYKDGHKGAWIADPEEYRKEFDLLWNKNYTISIHTNGDMGIDVVLDNVKRVSKNGIRKDSRLNIHHFGISEVSQVKDMAKYGVLASTNPFYVHILGEIYEKAIDAKDASQMVRHKTLLDNHIRFSMHSDAPMAPPSPLTLIWAAVNRLNLNNTKVIGANQRIGVMDALKAVTIDAAYALRLEDKVGSLKAGKIANLTVLDQDIFKVNPKVIKDVNVYATVYKGKIHIINHDKSKAEKTKKLALARDYKLYTDEQIYKISSKHHHGKNNYNIDSCEVNLIMQELVNMRDENKL